jgi:hypothetical protein
MPKNLCYYTRFVKPCATFISEGSLAASDDLREDRGVWKARDKGMPLRLRLEGIDGVIKLAGQQLQQDGAAVQEEGGDG